MAGQEVVINFDQVDEMVAKLRETAKMLRGELTGNVNSMAQRLDNEALKGKAGDAFAHALKAVLNPAIERLADKIDEQAHQVERERVQLFEAFKPN